MSPKRKQFLLTSLFVLFAIAVIGCIALDEYYTDDLIGLDWREGKPGYPIRQLKIADTGDPLARVGNTVIFRVPHPLYIRYIDNNLNGDFDKGIDEVIHRVPYSDLPVWGKLDPKNRDHFLVQCPNEPHHRHWGCPQWDGWKAMEWTPVDWEK